LPVSTPQRRALADYL